VTETLEAARKVAEGWDAAGVLAWGFARFRPHIAIASSFGLEDVVLIDIANSIEPGLSVFTLDTDFLFPETYELIDRVEARYGMLIERARPNLSPSEQAAEHGPSLWERDPDVCCRIRKVEPLKRALAGKRAWITGQRREQSSNRAQLAEREFDAEHGLEKFNPLASWSEAAVWTYIREREVPYNRLYDQGYRSIGCAPCTRPVLPGEDPRAGRWWWEQADAKECGLHVAPDGRLVRAKEPA